MQQSSHHSAAANVLVGANRALRLCRSMAAAGGVSLALSCGGCAISYPIGSMLPQSDDVTGSIKPAAAALLPDEEDRRRAKAALATALDPQGAGTAVAWDNPASGNKGSYLADGPAYPADSGICRRFKETAIRNGAGTSYEGKACAASGTSDWIAGDRKQLGKS